MKPRRSQVDTIIKLLLLSFKNNQNIPFTIPTMLCPDQPRIRNKINKKCKKRHSEIIVHSYNKQNDTFHLLYYGIHVSKVQFEFDQDEDVLFQIIKKTLLVKKYGLSSLIKIKDLRKILKTTKINRDKRITIRLSDKEYLAISSKAKRRNLEKSEYVRMELFS